MARSSYGKRAGQVKAVDDAYPLYGDVAAPARGSMPTALWCWSSAPCSIGSMSMSVSPLPIGEGQPPIGGVLGVQPDRLADRLAYGPKLLMSRDTLRAGAARAGADPLDLSGLTPPTAIASDKDALAATREAIETRFPRAASPPVTGPTPRRRSAATPTASPRDSSGFVGRRDRRCCSAASASATPSAATWPRSARSSPSSNASAHQAA